MTTETKSQLLMRFPAPRLARLVPPEPPEGFRLRPCRPGDDAMYLRLMHSAGFAWTPESVAACRAAALPGGIWFVTRAADDLPVATAMANRNPPAPCREGGELGWVAADPEFRGRRLGEVVCARILCFFREAGYRDVYLLTDDFRLPALVTYLRSGWEPVPGCDDDRRRWEAVFNTLGMTPA